MSNRKEKIKKGDKERVVLSESCPDEVPIIFSNEGFYKHCVNSTERRSGVYEFLPLFTAIVSRKTDFTIPYYYNIRKNGISLREMSLMHPSWQHDVIDFYHKYDDLICYYCSTSKVSLRYPVKVASTRYTKNKNENIHKYNYTHNVSTVETEKMAKHSSTYFSYPPCDKEHKFFNSELFLSLEKQYAHFWKLDVSKCFASIYTHSISWALKSKDFTKENLSRKMFGDDFDKIMQKGKHSETNGIVIGPEISRIFAEIIFQDIDSKIISRLSECGYKFDKDYTIRRYVDDMFIFAKTKEVAMNVSQAMSVELNHYNLHLNEKKHEEYDRPFFTEKSKIIFSVDECIRDFCAEITEKKEYEISGSQPEDETEIKKLIIPKTIRKSTKVKNRFIHSVKSAFPSENDGYGMVSGYIISCLSNRVISIIDARSGQIKMVESDTKNYVDTLLCLMDTMFFFYTVEPSVSSSYSIARAIILTVRFSNDHMAEFSPTVKQRILELFIKFYESQKYTKETVQKSNSIALEILNILISLTELGNDYLIPEEELLNIFSSKDGGMGYFEIISCLYYTKGLPCYDKVIEEVKLSISKKIECLDVKNNDAEQVYIILDILSCPYIDDNFRKKILKKICKDWNLNLSNIGSKDEQLKRMLDNPWFVNWKNIDLLSLLEKKKLSISY